MISLKSSLQSAKNKYGKAFSSQQCIYIYIEIPGHPNSDKNNMIAYHTYIMSCMLGRPLKKNELVHHKNGIRYYNSPENLELITREKHFSGQRVEDMIKHYKSYLSNYV